jgi:GDP-D-mannose 3',5'-epimerase
MKTALVCGAGGFIGSHLVKRLKKEGYWVRGVDLKNPMFGKIEADDFIVGDLTDQKTVEKVILMKFTNLLPTWVALAIFLPASTTRT